MAKRAKQREALKQQQLKNRLLIISLVILFAKLILILAVKHGGWLGADGESYLKGVDGLLKDGLFSKDSILVYWPAGYPVLMWLITFLSLSKLIYLVSFFQTLAYFGASLFFVDRIRRTSLYKMALPTALILGLNPTLSLSSLAIGYESFVASCMLASAALIIKFHQSEKSRSDLLWTVLWIGLLQGVSAFMQPRGLLIGFFIFLILGISLHEWKKSAAVLLLGTCVMMAFPAALMLRNAQAGNGAVISRNLGATMSLGAGDSATGGYANSTGVTCPSTVKNPSDNQLVKCVLVWYVKHPDKTAVLAVKKSVYFWSPWYGPLANGTMARNPWLKMDPIKSIDAGSRSGHNLVYGWFGKVISWIWLLAGLALFFLGLRWLWRMGGLQRQIAVVTSIPVFLAWVTSIGTIGDHRFRLPTLGLSLFLQVAGYFAITKRGSQGVGAVALEPRARAR